MFSLCDDAVLRLSEQLVVGDIVDIATTWVGRYHVGGLVVVSGWRQ